MKRLTVLCLMAVLIVSYVSAQPRKVTNMDMGWRFHLGDVDKAQSLEYDDASWRTLNVPHDWSIEGENLRDNPGGGSIGFFPTGLGWYRKIFDVKNYDSRKLYTIEFDGVYMNSTVWINGHELGTWPYGYSSFSYDLTPYLKKKGNVLAVRVDNSQQTNSRWYTGSGIYRHVRLVETETTHFAKWGVFNSTISLNDDEAVVRVKSEVENGEKRHRTLVLRHEIIDAKGNTVAKSEKPVVMTDSPMMNDEQTVTVGHPQAWSLETPYLYTLRSTLLEGKRVVDVVDNTLGIRTIDYPLDKGFLLNGKQVKMKGVNLHHDGGAVGAAVPERVWERRLEILKSGGCNAIRTAHNPPAPEFLDLCDRMGILVMDEAFDQWINGKNKQDYHLYYREWHERDLTAMVARDRNHPSVVMWSIGNEIRDQRSAEGPGEAAEMIAICHRLDDTRLVTSGNDEIASNSPTSPEFLAAFENDIIGYNYPDRWRTRREVLYAIDKSEFPNRRVVATESTGLGGPRRQYQWTGTMPPPQLGAGADGFSPQQMQQRPFGRRNRGLISSELIDVEHRWRFTTAYDYVIGDFMWTGIDYYGESWWPSRGSQSGYLDNCGFCKDGYWFFKSIWSDEPVLHLFPHWNWEGHEGQIMQVACYTNCEEVELFVNGKSYGKKATEFPRRGVNPSWASYDPGKHFATTADLHLTWDVEYQPGEIKVVGVRDSVVLEEVIRTAGAPSRLRATVDRPSFLAIPSDVAHVTIEVLDAEGNICPLSDNLVRFTVKGGRLLGVENGNMTDLGSVQSSERKAWSGKCLAIIAADRPGSVTVVAEADGLQPAEVTFTASSGVSLHR
jgi:beta-galactosidase